MLYLLHINAYFNKFIVPINIVKKCRIKKELIF